MIQKGEAFASPFSVSNNLEAKAKASRFCGGVRGGCAPSLGIKCLQNACYAGFCAATRQIFRMHSSLKIEAL
jgi:hypothetical protein